MIFVSMRQGFMMSKMSEHVMLQRPGEIPDPCPIPYIGVDKELDQNVGVSDSAVCRWYLAYRRVVPIQVAAVDAKPWATSLKVA